MLPMTGMGIVIASEAKQSRGITHSLDCFASLAMTLAFERFLAALEMTGRTIIIR
ncbi:hypothetical protein FACS1894181_07510 [Bacteroidia bacterium]|nr:hypothetical protein FACS1894181_07510 [Bacteroidia bacterium]